MQAKQDTGFSVEIQTVRDRLERWRGSRKKRTPIPEEIWQAAVRLAAEYGVSKTAVALRLNYRDLSNRLEATTAVERPAPEFVEMAWPAGVAPSPSRVELEHRSGARLKIVLGERRDALDIVALCEAFWRQKP